MNTVAIAGIVVGGIFLYIFIGVVANRIFSDLDDFDSDDAGFASAAWPISIPFFLIIFLGEKMINLSGKILDLPETIYKGFRELWAR